MSWSSFVIHQLPVLESKLQLFSKKKIDRAARLRAESTTNTMKTTQFLLSQIYVT